MSNENQLLLIVALAGLPALVAFIVSKATSKDKKEEK